MCLIVCASAQAVLWQDRARVDDGSVARVWRSHSASMSCRESASDHRQLLSLRAKQADDL